MADIDQAAIDEILAKAAEDTEEGRLEKLEREVEALKGSIKRLLLDIRETMNKLENPFVNLQSLAEGNIVPQSPPQIQIVPAKIPEMGKECEAEKEIEERKVEKEEMKVEEGDFKMDVPVQSSKMEEIREKMPEKLEKLEKFESETKVGKARTGKMDLITLFKLMEWVQSVIYRHSYDSFKLLLDIFSLTGYISDETRDLILKLAELAKLDGREIFVDLYRLHKIMNPNDRSLDSDLLALLLEKR